MPLDVQVRDVDGTLMVSVAGEMDMDTAWLLAERVDAALSGSNGASGPTIVLDASELSFLDSSGIAALLRLSQRTTESGGSLTVRSPSSAVRLVLRVTGLLDVFCDDQVSDE